VTEAEDVFAVQVEKWRATSWQDLQRDLDGAVAYSIDGSAGVVYQFEVFVLWDDPRAREDIRVIITGDDEKGWRFSDRRMRKDGFIKGLDGTFVGR
jgi:hypothetical protein